MSRKEGRAPADEGGADGALFSRREVLKAATGAAAVVAPLLGEALAEPRQPGRRTRARDAARAPRFFTPAEFAMVDELTEMIIPADDHSPGARAAGVAAYLDRRLAELAPAVIPEQAREQQTWREGLGMIDRLSREMHHGQPFMKAGPAERLALLERLAAHEPGHERAPAQTETAPTEAAQQTQQKPPGTDQPRPESPPAQKSEAEFFAFLKGQTARAYYTSEIGLLQELHYQGNRYLDEFAGYDVNGVYTAAPPREKKKAR